MDSDAVSHDSVIDDNDSRTLPFPSTTNPFTSSNDQNGNHSLSSNRNQNVVYRSARGLPRSSAAGSSSQSLSRRSHLDSLLTEKSAENQQVHERDSRARGFVNKKGERRDAQVSNRDIYRQLDFSMMRDVEERDILNQIVDRMDSVIEREMIDSCCPLYEDSNIEYSQANRRGRRSSYYNIDMCDENGNNLNDLMSTSQVGKGPSLSLNIDVNSSDQELIEQAGNKRRYHDFDRLEDREYGIKGALEDRRSLVSSSQRAGEGDNNNNLLNTRPTRSMNDPRGHEERKEREDGDNKLNRQVQKQTIEFGNEGRNKGGGVLSRQTTASSYVHLDVYEDAFSMPSVSSFVPSSSSSTNHQTSSSSSSSITDVNMDISRDNMAKIPSHSRSSVAPNNQMLSQNQNVSARDKHQQQAGDNRRTRSRRNDDERDNRQRKDDSCIINRVDIMLTQLNVIINSNVSALSGSVHNYHDIRSGRERAESENVGRSVNLTSESVLANLMKSIEPDRTILPTGASRSQQIPSFPPLGNSTKDGVEHSAHDIAAVVSKTAIKLHTALSNIRAALHNNLSQSLESTDSRGREPILTSLEMYVYDLVRQHPTSHASLTSSNNRYDRPQDFTGGEVQQYHKQIHPLNRELHPDTSLSLDSQNHYSTAQPYYLPSRHSVGYRNSDFQRSPDGEMEDNRRDGERRTSVGLVDRKQRGEFETGGLEIDRLNDPNINEADGRLTTSPMEALMEVQEGYMVAEQGDPGRNEETNDSGEGLRVDDDLNVTDENATYEELDYTELLESLRVDDATVDKIDHSVKVMDHVYEYRYVMLPRCHPLFQTDLDMHIIHHMLSYPEWRALGIRQTKGWEHFGYSPHESNVLLFRRPLHTNPRTGQTNRTSRQRVARRLKSIATLEIQLELLQSSDSPQTNTNVEEELNGPSLYSSSINNIRTIPAFGSTSSKRDFALQGFGYVPNESCPVDRAITRYLAGAVRQNFLPPQPTGHYFDVPTPQNCDLSERNIEGLLLGSLPNTSSSVSNASQPPIQQIEEPIFLRNTRMRLVELIDDRMACIHTPLFAM